MITLERIHRVMTFFAHPDDETLAAGATLSRLARVGVDIHVAIPATGVHSRRRKQGERMRDRKLIQLRRDCKKAMDILGVGAGQVYFGEFPDNEMDRHSLLEVVQWLENVIEKINPDVLLTHHRYCTNIDHRYCHEAAVIAARSTIHRHSSILCGEVPGSTGCLRPAQWDPNLYVEVSREDLERKVKAMKAYRGEARQDPHPRSTEVLKALAKVRGSEAGFHFAEAFMIQRIFA